MTAREALKKYFGYDDFRPGQAEIIESVLAGNDTLALMPTGGGKSLCFQIPTLAMSVSTDTSEKTNKDSLGSTTAAEKEGCLCLVITPLIALMKDQVENLKRRGILATAIYTGMSADKQRVALDNCLFGPYRFLYVSPERLESEEFRRRIVQLPIKLIAVDEAHCISQWGYDFRPAYLKIAEIRKLLPNVPVLALTATATPEVAEDITKRLSVEEKEWRVFRRSFHRENLHYRVVYTDKKAAKTIEILDKNPGCAIIYVRNRKRSEELATILNNNKISADFYHAGLSANERNRKQEEWKNDKIRVIVCTNAFGMGIDKPDVRLVIHHDIPDSIEAYFQEAGRAGRDGKESKAILLYNNVSDKTKARKRVSDNFPDRDFIENVYHKTCDYLQVGAGSGLGRTFFVDFIELCRVMSLPMLPAFSALQMLTIAGYIDFREEQEIQPRVRIDVPRESLYEYNFTPEQDRILNELMRDYTGIFTDLVYLRHLSGGVSDAEHKVLAELANRHVITYIPSMRAYPFTFKQERQTEIYIPKQIYDTRRTRYIDRLKAMVEYAEQTKYCREQVLLNYFGEIQADSCKNCDVCEIFS